MTRPWEDTTRVHDSVKGITLDTLHGSYVLGEMLYRRADRYIVRAQRTAASGCPDAPRVVVKFSLCTSPEEKLLHKAKTVAIDAGGEAHWVLRHLPNIIHAEDLQIAFDSNQARVAKIIDDVFCRCKSCEGHVVCEDSRPERLRIVIMEELFPIKTLATASDFAQVFFDVLNCHKWLYDHPCILHRDISMNNIMYRLDEQRNACGVLNDMDLSVDLDADSKETLLLRTGTPPFMAIDLLRKDSHQPEHIYRHDLESLFYVMLIVFARYELLAAEPAYSPKGQDRPERLVKRCKPPLSEWFDTNLSWEMLGKDKHIFIVDATELTSPLHPNNLLSSSFQGFKPWILRLKNALEDGVDARRRAIRKAGEALASGGEPPSFVYETLGGTVQYSTFFNAMKNFGAEALRAPPYSLDTNPTA